MAHLSEEYLAASIAKISSYMKISEAVAGATLLALANGAGDLLTVGQASSHDSDDLATGCLFGTNIFLATVVLFSLILASKGRVIGEVG